MCRDASYCNCPLKSLSSAQTARASGPSIRRRCELRALERASKSVAVFVWSSCWHAANLNSRFLFLHNSRLFLSVLVIYEFVFACQCLAMGSGGEDKLVICVCVLFARFSSLFNHENRSGWCCLKSAFLGLPKSAARWPICGDARCGADGRETRCRGQGSRG